jgi:hypothetical protein
MGKDGVSKFKKFKKIQKCVIFSEPILGGNQLKECRTGLRY